MKTCCRCKLDKEDKYFSKYARLGLTGSLQGYCKLCASEIHKFRRKLFPEKMLKRGRKNGLKYKYSISTEDFDNLVFRQSGKCAICETEMFPPNVDHCHTTGKIRGLLCRSCNTGIGFLKDSPKILISAARYLKLARYLK